MSFNLNGFSLRKINKLERKYQMRTERKKAKGKMKISDKNKRERKWNAGVKKKFQFQLFSFFI